jgi:hypothetical protein
LARRFQPRILKTGVKEVVMARPDMSTPEARARRRAKELSTLAWHASAFVVVNVFLWIQDLVTGGGLEYAYWTTIPWSIGLTFHAIGYIFSARSFEKRKYEEVLEQEHKREPQAG